MEIILKSTTAQNQSLARTICYLLLFDREVFAELDSVRIFSIQDRAISELDSVKIHPQKEEPISEPDSIRSFSLVSAKFFHSKNLR